MPLIQTAPPDLSKPPDSTFYRRQSSMAAAGVAVDSVWAGLTAVSFFPPNSLLIMTPTASDTLPIGPSRFSIYHQRAPLVEDRRLENK